MKAARYYYGQEMADRVARTIDRTKIEKAKSYLSQYSSGEEARLAAAKMLESISAAQWEIAAQELASRAIVVG